MKSKQKYLFKIIILLALGLSNQNIYASSINTPTLGSTCDINNLGDVDTNKYICQTRDSNPATGTTIWKGKQGVVCNQWSTSLTEEDWELYKENQENKEAPAINSKIDPLDNCARTMFCDNRKKCCSFGSCNWKVDPTLPVGGPDTPPKQESVPTSIPREGDQVFNNNNPSNDTEFQGGVQVGRDISFDSGDSATGGSGAGSTNRNIFLPDTELNDDGSSFLGEIERLINWTLGFLGILVFSMMLFSGFEYATAGGDEGKVTKAISRIKSTVIGLVILFFAFVTTNLIVGLALGRI